MRTTQSFLIFIFSLLISSSYASESPTPPLEEWISTVESGSEKYRKSANRLYKHYLAQGQLDSSLFYIRLAKKHAEDKNIEKHILWTYSMMTSAFQEIRQKDSVDFYINKQLNIIGDARDSVSLTRKSLILHLKAKGIFYTYNEPSNPKLYGYLREAADLAEEANNMSRYFSVLHDICNLYYGGEEQQKLIEILEEAKNKAKSSKDFDEKDSFYLGVMLFNAILIAENSTDKEERQEGVQQYKNVIELNQKNPYYLIGLMTDMTDMFGEDLEKDTLLKYSSKAYTLRKELDVPMNAERVTANYGKALYLAGEYKKAIVVLKEAEDLTNQSETPNYDVLESIADYLSLSYARLGQNKEYLEYYEKYKEYSEEIHEQEKENSLTELETKYDLRQEEAKNETLSAQNDLIQSRFQYLSIIGAALLALLLAGAYFFVKQRQTKRELEKLNASKNQLFAILAHDLKGPTSSFRNLTKKVSFLLKKNEPERLLELGEYFEQAGEQINYILSNLLDWAITQKDEFIHAPQKLDVKIEIDRVINNLEYAITAKGMQIENRIPVDKSLIFDKNALTVIVRNLLHNAIKFSHRDSSIIVDYDEFGLKVKDSGVGMSREVMQTILKSQHVESRKGTDDEKGNGIGLSTCVKLAENNKAKLKIESEEGVGTTFILEV